MPPTAASLKAQRTVNVEVMSATAARVSAPQGSSGRSGGRRVWGDFKPAPGLTMLEYEVRATPGAGHRQLQGTEQMWDGSTCAVYLIT